MSDLFRVFKTRLATLCRWQILKYQILFILVIAAFFSVLDYVPDWRIWSIEVLRDIVMVGSIGGVCFLMLGITFPNFRVRGLHILPAAFLLMVGGALGGLLGWFINKNLFGFQVSMSVPGFMVTMGAFASLLGIAPTMAINLLAKLKKTLYRLHEQELTAQRALQLKTKAELEALRAKVNPHFLFNTLNSIASLIPADPVNAEKMVQKLAQLFRYTLYAGNRDFVPLKEEIAVIESYLEIERMRFGERLKYTLYLDPALDNNAIPGMLLQPLVENSLIHGIDRNPGGGSLSVLCQSRQGRCRIEIRNSGDVPSGKPLIKGFGLTGVIDRLDLLYGDDYSFTFSPGPPVNVVLTLPLGSDRNS